MTRRNLFLALTAIALVLGTSSKAQAWGAVHVGYTHVGYGGVQHVGYTAGVGRYGEASATRYSAYGVGGAYHASYGAAAYHPYTPTYSAGYAVGGYHYGTAGYSAGVYRRW